MPINLYDKIKPKGEFAIADAADIEMPDGKRLEEAFEELKNEAGSGGVSSWNDLTDKPFGEGTEVIFEGQFQDTLVDSDEDGVNDAWSGSMGIEDASDTTLEVGKIYSVTWEETEYECECSSFYGMPIIGNPISVGGDDNGMPFAVLRDETGSIIGTPGWTAMIINVPEDLTVSGLYSCRIVGDKINPLENKYLDILEGREAGETEIIAEQTFEWTDDTAMDGIACSDMAVPEEKYIVFWDGTEYELIAFDSDGFGLLGNGSLMGSYPYPDTGEPFLIAPNTYEAIILVPEEAMGSHTFRVLKAATDMKLKEKHLPDGAATKDYVHEYVEGKIQTEKKVSAVDLSGYESGTVVETYTDGTSMTYTFEYDEDGNPVKITDSDGSETVLTW